jgi:molybdopterin-guanine dinucleotide biosynthesis protein A
MRLGVILCGGHSSRFGSDKARAEVDGVPLISAVARALAPWCSRVLAVADVPGKYADLGLETIADLQPHLGPVGGIGTALGQGDEPWLLVSPCDLVRPQSAWFADLARAAQPGRRAAAVHHAGRWQPLPCLLARAVAVPGGGGSVFALLEALAAERLARPACWPEQLSANAPAELAALSAAPIPVTLLYFASLAERLGRDREELSLPAGIDDRGLCALLAARHPVLAELLARTRVAADQSFVRGSLALRPGLEIALIPPVSGG